MRIKLDGPKGKQEFADLIEAKRYKVGAEIGIREGELALLILAKSCIKEYYMVDPWCHQEPSLYHSEVNFPQEDHEAKFQRVMKLTEPYIGKAIVMRFYSADAAPMIKDESLDFVYIDGNHAYTDLDKPGIRQDLHLWVPKVKPGCMIAGHDFLDEKFPERIGVKTAVKEFFPEDQLVVTSEFKSLQNPPIWWTIRRQ